MTDDETQAVAQYYEDQMTQGWKTAFEAYATQYPTTRHIHSPRTRASVLHDHCVNEIEKLALTNKFIVIPPKKQGLFTVSLSGEPLGIDGSVLARFKKLSPGLLTSNISTKQVRDFNNQNSMSNWKQGELFGEPLVEKEPPHINIGYLPDKFWHSFEAVFATMPNGSHALHWYVKLADNQIQTQTPVINMPIQPVQPQVRRVTAKRSAPQKKQNEQG